MLPHSPLSQPHRCLKRIVAHQTPPR
jgi:hypothetical protein